METTALAELPFNHKVCDVPGYESCWVRFKTSGYPRRLRREWDRASPERTIEIITRYIVDWDMRDLNGNGLIIGNVHANFLQRADIEARLTNLDLPIAERTRAKHELTAMADALGDAEDAIVSWLIRTFLAYWLQELPSPRKNSLPPSTTAP